MVCFNSKKVADRYDIRVEVKNAKNNKCNEIVMNDYSLKEKIPVSYKREKQDCRYITIDACTNSCEMHQTVNIKAILESASAPHAIQYRQKDKVIQKTVVADKSGAMGLTFYS